MESVETQIYPAEIELVIVDNRDHHLSIGAGFNEIARRATHDWILYLGDDDFIQPDYVTSLIGRLLGYPNEVVSVASYCTLFDGTQRELSQKIVTALWSKAYLLDHPWDEDLQNMVDTAQFKQANMLDAEIALQSWNYGYFYRQHAGNVSGNKFEKRKTYPVQIYGHKRSGNHYLSVLIDHNFTQTGDPVLLLGGHGFLNDVDVNTKYIYIQREFESMVESLWRYRHRQGLEAASLEEFKKTPYNEMWTSEMSCDVQWDFGTDEANDREVYTGVVDYFKDITMTPKEFHDLHRDHFRAAESCFKNILIVQYEDLLTDFTATMDHIADFLGYPRGSYTDIQHKVGWYAKGDTDVHQRSGSERTEKRPSTSPVSA